MKERRLPWLNRRTKRFEKENFKNASIYLVLALIRTHGVFSSCTFTDSVMDLSGSIRSYFFLSKSRGRWRFRMNPCCWSILVDVVVINQAYLVWFAGNFCTWCSWVFFNFFGVWSRIGWERKVKCVCRCNWWISDAFFWLWRLWTVQ